MRRLLRIYGPWLIAPTLALGMGLALASLRSPNVTFAGPEFQSGLVRDPKIRRTGKMFIAEALSDPAAEPLSAVNRQGLPMSIELDSGSWSLMRQVPNRQTYKRRAVYASVRFADRPPRAIMLRLRGGGSLGDPDRPNFRISLITPEQFTPGVAIRTLFLMNLRFDPAQVKMVFGYRLLAKLGLFHPHHQFVRVSVNGEPMGMFLLVEPPNTAIRRAVPDAVRIYRRRGRNIYSTEWTDPLPDAGAMLNHFSWLNFQSDSPPDPVGDYLGVFDLDAYFTWISINSLIYNTDMGDELYIIERRTDQGQPMRLQIMGWDYDDTFALTPRSRSMPDPLIYSSRDPFDWNIQRTPALYDRLKRVMHKLLLNELSVEQTIGLLREVQVLRDGLDDGRPPELQAQDRQARAKTVAEYERLIRRRHAELLRAIGQPPPALPIHP